MKNKLEKNKQGKYELTFVFDEDDIKEIADTTWITNYTTPIEELFFTGDTPDAFSNNLLNVHTKSGKLSMMLELVLYNLRFALEELQKQDGQGAYLINEVMLDPDLDPINQKGN